LAVSAADVRLRLNSLSGETGGISDDVLDACITDAKAYIDEIKTDDCKTGIYEAAVIHYAAYLAYRGFGTKNIGAAGGIVPPTHHELLREYLKTAKMYIDAISGKRGLGSIMVVGKSRTYGHYDDFSE